MMFLSSFMSLPCLCGLIPSDFWYIYPQLLPIIMWREVHPLRYLLICSHMFYHWAIDPSHNCFTTPNLECCPPSSKRRGNRWKRRCGKKKLGLWGGKVGILWGPQILKCQGIYIPAPIWACKMPLHTTLGVQRQVGAHFGRSTPIY